MRICLRGECKLTGEKNSLIFLANFKINGAKNGIVNTTTVKIIAKVE